MYINLTKRKYNKLLNDFIETHSLSKIMSNKRTTIWQNEIIKIAVDKDVIRMNLSDDSVQFSEHVENFFRLR